jgi:hypothetical protein
MYSGASDKVLPQQEQRQHSTIATVAALASNSY